MNISIKIQSPTVFVWVYWLTKSFGTVQWILLPCTKRKMCIGIILCLMWLVKSSRIHTSLTESTNSNVHQCCLCTASKHEASSPRLSRHSCMGRHLWGMQMLLPWLENEKLLLWNEDCFGWWCWIMVYMKLYIGSMITFKNVVMRKYLLSVGIWYKLLKSYLIYMDEFGSYGKIVSYLYVYISLQLIVRIVERI